MGQLDASIVQLAMPSLETAFDAPVNAVSWVAVGYMLAVACALPIFARLAEIAGRKTFFLSGFASFAILSTLCGFAPTLASLTGLRVLLGVGAAMTGANSVVILVTAAGPERRGRALGIMAAAQAVGFALGPTLGGLLLGTLGWRWVFWVNVPLSIAAFVLSCLSFETFCGLIYRRLVVLGSLLKSHAMTGWRMGWMIAHRSLVDLATALADIRFSRPAGFCTGSGFRGDPGHNNARAR